MLGTLLQINFVTKKQLFSIFYRVFLLTFFTFNTISYGQNLLHNFEFNGNLNDTNPTGATLTAENLNTSSFGTNPNSFTWVQATNPGGGLSLLTDQLPDPTQYSLGFRISFKETGSGYKKILSYKGAGVDNGLYFQNSNLEFYPFGKNASVTYQPNTFYDFVLTRTTANNIKVYVIEPNGTVTKVYDKQDTSNASVPRLVNGKHELLFFMDDTHTNSEHSSGGTVRGIRMWDKALSPEQIGAALSSVTTEPPKNVTTNMATLVGEVNPQGSLSTFEFEYGTSTSYGATIPASPSSSSGTSAIIVTADVSNLAKEQVYHYRLKSTNTAGVSYGSDVTFIASPDHDNDGVSDINDLDDDNDGILDTVEGAKATIVGTAFNTGSGTGNVTGTLSSVSGSITYNIAFQNIGNLSNGGVGNASEFFNGGKEISCASTIAGSDNTFTFTPQGAATLSELKEVIVDVSWVSTGNVISFNQPLNTFALKSGTSGSISSDGKTVTITSGSNSATAGFTAKLRSNIVNPFVVNGKGTSNDTFTIKVAAIIFDKPDTDNDGIENSLDLDSDGDGCNDVSEVYSASSDPDGDGVFGNVNQTVDVNGLVIAAGVTGNAYNTVPRDNDSDSVLDVFQASQTFGAITTQPIAVTSFVENPAVFTLDFSTTGIGTAPIIQWYTKKAGTTAEILLTDVGIYSGVTTKTLTISGYKPINNGDVFYAKISTLSSLCSSDDTTNEVMLNVKPHTLVANNDSFTIIKTSSLAISSFGIHENDLLQGNVPVLVTEAILKASGTFTTNKVGFESTTGKVIVNSNLAAGVYTFEYDICEVADPTNCQTATVTVTVLEDSDLDGVADINDLDDDNDGILDTEEGTCTLPAQMRLGYIPDSRDLDSDDGYTIDGSKMTGLKSKLENPFNFGPIGTVKTEIILVPITSNPISKTDLDNLNLDAIFIGGIDKTPIVESWLSSAEFSAIKTWSLDPNKTVIVTQASSVNWGRNLITGNANPDKPNAIGAATSIFSGPFGTVTQFNQGGSYQAVYTPDTSKNDDVLALDSNNERVIIKDGVYNDILLSDVDILTSVGGVSNGSGIVNDNDRLAMNLIYTAIPLSSCPGTDIDLDGVSNSLDLDSDGDGCNDVSEAYSAGDDADGDGVFGTGTPTVDADGKVVGASYGTPADGDANGIDDYKQTSQKLSGVTTQPANQVDKLITDTATFTVVPNISGTGTAFVYQWEEKKNGTSTWSTITDGLNYSGAATNSLVVTNLQSTQNGDLYRAIITSNSYLCDTDITSNSASLSIKASPIIIGNDSNVIAEKEVGTVIPNILSNDLVNGLAATVSNVTITLVGSLPVGISLNTSTGEVTSDASTTPGIYNIKYQLCEIADPTNCTGTATNGIIAIAVLEDTDGDLVSDVNDLDDDNDGILDSIEDAVNSDVDNDGTINSLDTDSDNDSCLDTQEVYGASAGFGANPVVDTNGLVIAAGITGAVYTTLPADNDTNGTSDFIQASKSLIAITDQPTDHISNINKPVTFAVKTSSQGAGTDLEYQWQEKPSGGTWSDISDNANFVGTATNTLVVTPSTSAFNGSLYRVSVSTPSYNCDSDIVSNEGLIVLSSHVINANPDNSTLVEKKSSASFINVLTNDLIDHSVVLISDINLTQLSTSSAGVSLNTATGDVSISNVVTEGIYFLDYQICEKIDPTNCAIGSVTIVVQKDTDLDGIPDVTDPDIDNDGNLNGTDSNPYLPVSNDDSATVKVGQATEVDLLSNDDFLSGATTTITSTGGTAIGTIAFNNLTGKLTYTPTLAEAGTDVTVIYEVTNSATGIKSSATATLSVDDEADLSLAILVDNATPNVGGNVVFTITATNGGPSNATNVDINSKLSNGYTFVSATPSAGTYDAVTGNWFVGSVANGATPTLAITATVNASGTYTQVTEVTFSDQSDPDSTAGNGNSTEDDYASISTVPIAQTDLVTIISLDNTTPNEGDDIAYQIRVTNNGPSDATNVQITSATIPTGITYRSDDGSGDYVDGTGIWTIGSLASGASTTLHILGAVNSGQAGNTINNTIVTSLTETDPSTTGDVLTAGLTVNQAVLTTTIVVDNSTPNEGDTVKYTITTNNGGANEATGIALTSVLPSGVTYVSDNGGGNYNSATGIWNPTSIVNGGNASLEITATVNSGTSGSTISNKVIKISTDQIATNTLPAATADITVKSINLVSVIAVDNSTPNEGGTIKYTITITNSGTDTATNVVVTDLLPSGVTYVSDNGSGGYVSGTGVWTIGSLASAANTSLEITGTVDGGTAGTHITNTISSVAATETDNSTSGDILSSTISVTSSNLVTVIAIPNSTPNVNDAYTYTITVTNNGPGNATGISLTSVIPSGLTHTSSSATVGSFVSGTGVWTMGNIASGSSAKLTINTTVNADQGNVLNTIATTAAIGDQTDSTTSGDVLSESFTPTSANLITVLSVNNPTPDEGDTVIFTVKVKNVGPSNETNVAITTDTWPISGVTYASDDGLGAYVNGTGIWTIGSIASGATAALNITGTVNATTGGNSYTFKSIAPASGDQTDLVTTGDVLSTSITVQQAKLATSIAVNNPSPNVGSTVTYTVTVKNNGPSTDHNVSLTSLVPSGLTYVSSTPSLGTYNNGSGVWALGSITNGATQTLTITATVDAGQGGNTINSSTTAAVGDHTDTSVSNPNLSTSITVTSANLVTVKSVNNTLPDEGDTVIYSIKVTNNGPNDETNVSLTDVLPTGVTYVSETASQGTYTNGTGLWTIGNIANGDTKTLDITATVDAATSGTTITNTTTTASGDQSDPTTIGDVLSADINITSSDILTVLSVSNTSPNVGNTIIYTINVTNNGPNDDTNVSLTTAILSALSGVTYVSDDGAGDYVSGTGIWTIGSITSGDTKTLNITATIDAGTGGNTITNTTSAAVGDQGDPSTLGDVLSAVVNVTSADLITTISVDNANPNEGDTVTYTINVNNNGPNDETNVSLEDHLPSGVTFVSATTANGSYSNGTGVWTIGSISKYTAASLILTGTVDTGKNAQTITNTIVSRAAGDQSDPTTVGDNLSASLTVSSANLVTVISVDNANPNEGDAITYTVVVTNNGPNDETSVSLTSVLPTGINFTSAIETQGSYVSGTGLWTTGTITKNSSETLTLLGTVASGASLTNSITTSTTAAKGSIADSNTTGDVLSVDINVTQSNLITAISVDNPIPNEGDSVAYTIHVTNNGPNNETNASLTSILPTGLTYVSDNGSGTFNHATGLWTIGSIAKNSSKNLVITATVNANTSGNTIITSTTPADGDQADPSSTSDVLSKAITIGNYSDIVLGKTVDNPTPNTGDTINYTISVTNNGPANVTNLVINDVLPSGLTFVNEFAGTGIWNTGASTWTIASLASGDTKNLIIQAKVNLDQGGNTIVNTISNTQDQTDSNATADDDNASITVTYVDLFAVKTVNNTTPNVGDTVSYSITVTNKTGSSEATNVSITDVLPVGLTYVSNSATQGIYNSGSGLWSVGSLTDGASALLIINAIVNNGTEGTTITNTASALTVDQSDSNTTADVLSAAINVTSTNLVTIKTVNISNPTEGQDIIYTITVTNNAGNDATDVRLIDRLPAGVTYKSDDSGLYNSTSGEWIIGNLSSGATSTINITTTVNSGTGNTTITNTTTSASGDQTDPTTVGDVLSATINVVSTDLVTVNSVNVSNANIGDTVTYTITVTNNGPSIATNVSLTDLLPAGVTYVSDNSGGDYASGTGVWTIGAIANGATSSINILATVDASSGGKTITNVISARAVGSEADPTTAGDTLSVSFNVISNDLETSLTVDKANPNEKETIIYTLTVKNNGPSDATGVSITDNLPTGVSYVSHSTINGTFNSGAGIWTIGSLAKNAIATITINATVNQNTGGTTIVNTTNAATANYNDPNLGNNSSSASITVGNNADIVLTNTVNNRSPNVGDTVTFTITATNNGPTAIQNLVVANDLPTGLTYGLVTPSNGTWTTPNWIIGALDSGKTETLTITATVDSGTGGQYLTHTVSNSQNQTDSNLTTDDFSEIVTITSTDLVTTNKVSNSTPNEGEVIVYTISVMNNGPNDATNVSLVAILPAGLTYISDDVSGAYNQGSGTWTIGTIGTGLVKKLNITVSVDAGTGGTSIVNVISKSLGDQTDPNTIGDSLTESITVSSSELVTVISVDNASPNEGASIMYTIKVNNQGPSDATNISLVSNLPPGITFDSFVAPVGTVFNPGSGVWTINSIANHSTVSLSIMGIVALGTGGTTILNTVTEAIGDQSDANNVPDILSVPLTVSNTSDIVVVNTVNNNTPNVGDVVTFTVTISNNQGALVDNLVLEDVLPNGLTYDLVTVSSGTWAVPNWNIGDLPVGKSESITIQAIVNAGMGGNSVTNTVSHTQTQTDSNITLDDLSETITITSTELMTVNTIDNASPNEGDTVSYSIVVTNNGPNDATSVQLTDNLPAGLTYGVANVSIGSYNVGSGIWNIGSLTNGNSATFVVSGTINSGTGGSTITNTTSEAIGDQSDPSSSGDVLSVDLTVTSTDLVTIKTVDNSSPNEGDTIVYTIEVTNNGASEATNVFLIDQIPSGLTYISDDASGDYDNGSGVWQLGTLMNAEVKTIHITAMVDSGTGVAQSAIINNTTAAKGDQSDPTSIGDVLSAEVNVTSVDLVTSLSVDNTTPNVGEIIEYTVSVVNNGPSDGTDVKLTCLLPNGVTYVSDDGSGSYDIVSGIWSLGVSQNGATNTLKIKATIDVGEGGSSITNSTTAAKGIESDPITATDNLSVIINITSSDLVTKKTVSTIASGGSAFEGEVIKYTITVFNNGTSNATNVSLTDNLPVGITYRSYSVSQGTFNGGSGLWTIGSIGNNDTVTLTVDASVDALQAGNTITNTTSRAIGDQSDPTNVGDELSSVITIENNSDIVLSKVVDNKSPNIGDLITYTITATNLGPAEVTNFEVIDALPTGLTYGIVTPSVGTWTSPKWSIGSLVTGSSATITIQAIVGMNTGGQTLVNTITKTHDQIDSEVTTDDLEESIIVTSSELITTKSVTSGGVEITSANEGESITYLVEVENVGPNDATNVGLTDLLPVGVTYVSDNSSGTYNSGSGLWSIGSISNGAKVTLEIIATVDANTSGQTITNITTPAIGDQSDPDTIVDDLEASFVVKSESDIVLTKSVDNSTPNEGDTVTYLVTVTNSSGATATNLVVTDALPSGLQYGTVSPTQGTWTAPNWNVGTLSPGQTASVSIQAIVGIGTQGLTLVNTVSNSQDQTDTNVSLDDATATIRVTSVDLGVTKMVSNQSPNEGDVVIYTIKVENNGPSDATGVSLSDVLPVGVTYIGHSTAEGTYNQGSGLWDIGSIVNSGSATLTINVSVNTGTNNSTITNITTSVIADQADPNLSNNIGEVTIIPGSTIDLSLVKSVLGNNLTPNVGDVITFEIVIANEGPNLATGVEVIDLLPSGLKFVKYNSSSPYNEGSGLWNVGSLAKGNTKILFIDAEVLAVGNYVSCAEVTKADEVDVDSTPGNGIDTEDDYDCITFVPQTESDLQVTASIIGSHVTPNIGDNISIEVNLKNNGPLDATNVEVTSLIPTGYTLQSVSSTNGVYNETNGIWTLTTIKNLVTETLVFNVSVNPTGDYINCSEVTKADQVDSNTVNIKSCISTTPLSVADIEIRMKVDKVSPLTNNNVEFTITVVNRGPSDATGVEVKDFLPSGFEFDTASMSVGSYDEYSGVWIIGTVVNGTSEVLRIVSKVLSVGDWRNTAEVIAMNEIDPDSTPDNADDNEDDIAEVEIVPNIQLTIPEEFTPNGDGINDLFEIPNLSVLYPDFKIVIVNRWGNKVFAYKHSGNPNTEPVWWNGYSDGGVNLGSGDVPDGTYFYTIEFNNNDRAPQTGWVYLRR